MANLNGQVISHYRVVEKIGAGGMGEVFRAVDNRLGRTVAIKILPPDLLADADRRQRFTREAQTASSLNHPNIVTIHDIGSKNGADYIVMEFVEGKTLESEIGRRPMALTPLLRTAVQIADALTAAHTAGIVHRDLKPTNIMVNKQGLVKVLDFGLAKLAGPSPHRPSGTETAVPETTMTLANEPSRPGMVLGTASYMSPEQGDGREVDARSDIFSFGSVLYEMATGRRAFQGSTAMSTIASVLRDEPKPASTQTAPLPHDLEKIISRCLRKDPARRFQTMADLKVALEELKEDSETGKLMISAPATVRERTGPRRLIGGLALVALAAAVGVWMYNRRVAAPAANVVTRLTFDTGYSADPAISPDGKLMAYVSDRAPGEPNIWLQQMADGQAVQLTKHEGRVSSPKFSPDGAHIVYGVSDKDPGVYMISAIGGVPRRLAPRGSDPAVSPDGSWVSYSASSAGKRGYYVVPVGGGAPKLVTEVETGGAGTAWVANGTHLLFAGVVGNEKDSLRERADWYVVPVAGGKAVRTGVAASLRAQNVLKANELPPAPSVAVGDSIFFSVVSGVEGTSGNIWRLRLDPKTFQPAGPAVQVTFGTALEDSASVSRTGTLVYSSTSRASDYWILPLNADEGKVTGTRASFVRNSASDNGHLSSDGSKFLYCSSRGGNSDIWMRDVRTGNETTVMATPAEEHVSAISADASRILYSVHGTTPKVYLTSATGAEPQFICENCGHSALSPDASRLLYITEPNHHSYRMLNVSSGKSVEFVGNPASNFQTARFTPDGKWVIFIAGKSSFLAPVRDSLVEEKDWIPFRVESRAIQFPQFSPKGTYLYFVSPEDGRDCVYAQRLDPSFQPVGKPVAIEHLHEGVAAYSHPHSLSVGAGNLIMRLNQGSGTILMTQIAVTGE